MPTQLSLQVIVFFQQAIILLLKTLQPCDHFCKGCHGVAGSCKSMLHLWTGESQKVRQRHHLLLPASVTAACLAHKTYLSCLLTTCNVQFSSKQTSNQGGASLSSVHCRLQACMKRMQQLQHDAPSRQP